MKLPFDTDDERGQVGVGTLIIFIAMVLVAAVAAGVLVNTSGMLQSKASDTGEDAQAQVSNQVKVASAVGHTDESRNVERVNFTVAKSAGSGDIDLGEMSIQYVSAAESRTVEATGETVTILNTDGTEATGAETTLDEEGEQLILRIETTAPPISSLGEGERATVRLIDQSGATTVYNVDTPSTLYANEYVRV